MPRMRNLRAAIMVCALAAAHKALASQAAAGKDPRSSAAALGTLREHAEQ
jgi:hypothetical protein